jgi:hypothetical protein
MEFDLFEDFDKWITKYDINELKDKLEQNS